MFFILVLGALSLGALHSLSCLPFIMGLSLNIAIKKLYINIEYKNLTLTANVCKNYNYNS